MINERKSAINVSAGDFRKAAHSLVDTVAGFLNDISNKPVTTGETPARILELLGNETLPGKGIAMDEIITKATELLYNHSLLNGHPKFFGYITGSPAPIAMLADLMAASVNANVGAQVLSPVATAIEKQTIRWLAEFIGFDESYGGILVSGGNMANFTAFLAGRTAKAPDDFKTNGLSANDMVMYCCKTTHTWIDKAAVLFGHGTNAIRWIPADRNNRMEIPALVKSIEEDLSKGKLPFMIIGNAGDVSTGAVDDLSEISKVCKKFKLWFHVDGAYGIPAAVVPEYSGLFSGIADADSIALDPHKWLYSPLEVGCTLVKNPQHLLNTFSSHPAYYHFENKDTDPAFNFYEYGLQNSRGFRALKIWMQLQQVGKEGYINLIRDDIALAELMYELASKHSELEAVTHNLSITTLRYIPSGVNNNLEYLNKLNTMLLEELQRNGEVFLSNAVIEEKFCLRACIVNFRTTSRDIHESIDIIVKSGKEIHKSLSGE